MAPVLQLSMISDLSTLTRRKDYHYYNPAGQVYAGLWCLWAGATMFLAMRVWCKVTRRHGLWYDDYILILSWVSNHNPIPPSWCCQCHAINKPRSYIKPADTDVH